MLLGLNKISTITFNRIVLFSSIHYSFDEVFHRLIGNSFYGYCKKFIFDKTSSNAKWKHAFLVKTPKVEFFR